MATPIEPETARLLLEVWREACRHIEIQGAAEAFAQILAEHMPLEWLVVRRFDRAQSALETVAIAGTTKGKPRHPTWTTMPPATWKRLNAWAKTRTVARIESSAGQARPDEWAALIPAQLTGTALAGPLTDGLGPEGAIILLARDGEAFQEHHARLLSLLLESFSVALENDRRLYELNTLREAAEADRRSLLTRLGRQDVTEEIIGANAGLRHVMERVELVAKSDVPVLILGETGTGKEVISRAIHTRSKRGGGPFIRVNCGAIPPELIDSQLFGHEKGSFTGAGEQHQGWFERADGGTLFLDEIGELPLAAQVRLLRVLQDHQIERVGGKQSIRVDVRIVAATHRDLASMVKARTFREDLWYRINVFPLLLPRLRERLEDIPALVRHFSHRAAVRFGLPYVEASPTDLLLLANYSWPGNIREFGVVIDRAAILGNGKSLEIVTALGLNQVSPPPTPLTDEPTLYEVIPVVTQPLVQSPSAGPPRADQILTLDAAMKEHIERALAATRGRIEGDQGAAKLLDINPHTLRARMRKLEIDWSKFRG